MSDLFSKVEGVDFYRLPITDEQAPLPAVFDRLYELIEDERYGLILSCVQLDTEILFSTARWAGAVPPPA